MFKERLLERIEHMEEDSHYRPDSVNIAVELRSILSYLQKILSTKQGSTLIAYDFGIPDVSNIHDRSYGQYIDEMEESLRKTIEQFEPRLTEVKVSHINENGQKTVMYFKIEAQLTDHTNTPVLFETVINPDGKIAIHE